MRISSFIKTTAKAVLFLVACLLAGSEARAQEFMTDTLRLQVYFRQDISRVEPEYRDNGRRLHDFKQEAAADSAGESGVEGGAILLDDQTMLTVDGGSSRSVLFSNNEVRNARADGSVDALGGAIAVGTGCVVNLQNAQFTGNVARSGEGTGNGGAIGTKDAGDGEARVTYDGHVHAAHCMGGMLHVSGDRVDILSTVFEWKDA